MDIEAWFESMPSDVVNSVAQDKRYIMFAIHDVKALSFKNQDYIIKEILTMSRRVKNARNEQPTISPGGKSSNARSVGSKPKTRWASADIRNKEDKAAIRELAANPNLVLDTIVELIDDGYDLHVKRTDEGSTVRSMLFSPGDHPTNANGGLSADAPDAWLSLTTLVYKHVHKLDGRWFDDDDTTGEDDGWR